MTTVTLSDDALARVCEVTTHNPLDGLVRMWCEILGLESLDQHPGQIQCTDYGMPSRQVQRILDAATAHFQAHGGDVGMGSCAFCMEFVNIGPTIVQEGQS